jgi:hypothetical protein
MDIVVNGAPGRHVRRPVDAAVCIDAELYDLVRNLAAVRGESVRDVVTRALGAYAQGRSGSDRRCACPPEADAASTVVSVNGQHSPHGQNGQPAHARAESA